MNQMLTSWIVAASMLMKATIAMIQPMIKGVIFLHLLINFSILYFSRPVNCNFFVNRPEKVCYFLGFSL